MKLTEITPLVITYNEAPNIRRCLEKLRWASHVLVMDSGSTDATLDICASFPGVRVVHRRFDSFARQCNFGLKQITTPWVLSMDADYMVPRDFAKTLEAMPDGESVFGYRTRIRYCIEGHPLRSGLYPPRTVLYRRKMGRYIDDGHGHHVCVSGTVLDLPSVSIDHDDRKPMVGWLQTQVSYALAEAEKLDKRPSSEFSRTDRLRAVGWVVPLLVLPYCLLWRRGILDGWPGWSYALQRLTAEVMLAILIVERRLKESSE